MSAVETNKARFTKIFSENIRREGADRLVEYLTTGCDFFTCPASARYHGAFEGGLCAHSLNVYDCLVSFLESKAAKDLGFNYSPETVATVSLLHDVCKIGCYKVSYRNVKDDQHNVWQRVPFYEFSDPMPYGHGEKSVYMLSGYLRLTREEAFAIRYHMGFSGVEEKRDVGAAFEKYPLAYALSHADMMATFFLEGKE
jgi:hypothetical protein